MSEIKPSTEEKWWQFARKHYAHQYTDEELAEWLKSYQHKYGSMDRPGFYEVENHVTGEPFTVWGYIQEDGTVYRAI